LGSAATPLRSASRCGTEAERSGGWYEEDAALGEKGTRTMDPSLIERAKLRSSSPDLGASTRRRRSSRSNRQGCPGPSGAGGCTRRGRCSENGLLKSPGRGPKRLPGLPRPRPGCVRLAARLLRFPGCPLQRGFGSGRIGVGPANRRKGFSCFVAPWGGLLPAGRISIAAAVLRTTAHEPDYPNEEFVETSSTSSRCVRKAAPPYTITDTVPKEG
jgi:hypothetical protein